MFGVVLVLPAVLCVIRAASTGPGDIRFPAGQRCATMLHTAGARLGPDSCRELMRTRHPVVRYLRSRRGIVRP